MAPAMSHVFGSIRLRLAETFTGHRDPGGMEHGFRDLIAWRVAVTALRYDDVSDQDLRCDDSVLALAVGCDHDTGGDCLRKGGRGASLAGSYAPFGPVVFGVSITFRHPVRASSAFSVRRVPTACLKPIGSSMFKAPSIAGDPWLYRLPEELRPAPPKGPGAHEGQSIRPIACHFSVGVAAVDHIKNAQSIPTLNPAIS